MAASAAGAAGGTAASARSAGMGGILTRDAGRVGSRVLCGISRRQPVGKLGGRQRPRKQVALQPATAAFTEQ